jgi:ribosomal protein L16 Arg81 hydroxylase
MLRCLSDVVAPLPVAEFLRAYQEKQRLHIAGRAADRAASLLPWSDVEALIALRGFADMEAMQNGMSIPPQLYQDEPDLGAFHDMLAQGASLVFTQIDGHVPAIQQLATAIERQLGVTVGVNAYLSFSTGGAFKPHWDRHDALVLQVHGRKRWTIWDATFENPVEKSRYARHDITGAPAQEVELSAGDVLYIPRGEPHAAAVCGESSVHLTLGLNSLNGVDMLGQLAAAAAADEFLRADLPSRHAPAGLPAHEAELKARLHRLVETLDIAAFLDHGDASRAPARRPSLVPSTQPEDVLRLTLRRQVPLPEGDAVREGEPVIIGGTAYALSPAAVEILRRLFARDGQRRDELHQALSGPHQRAAVDDGLRELLRLGFLTSERAV